MGDCLDAAEVILQGEVFVRGVSVLVGQAEADEDAGYIERVVHLGDEWDGAAFSNKDGFFAKAFLQCSLRFAEDRSVIGSNPGFAGTQDFELADYGFGKQFSDVLLDELRDLLRILIGNQACGEFRPGF